jgi:gluconate 2-dehydrogenase gamma chain
VADRLNRSDFFELATAAGAATVIGGTPALAPQRIDAAPISSPVPNRTVAQGSRKVLVTQPSAFTFLTPPERAFVEAAIDRLIPADDSGAGAREAAVAYYIDRQLAGAWGSGAGQYRQGPWMAGTPEQGYQLNMIPQELYRVGIAQTDAACKKRFGKTFEALSPAHQDEVLHGLEDGTIALADVPGKTFFGALLNNTIEGFFADPLYGGNHDRVGWKAVGFPGVAAAYIGVIEKYNVPYKVEPVGIADVEQGVVPDHDHAYEGEHRERVAMMHRQTRREA